MSELVFFRPLDILHLRGNHRFGDAGHGEAVLPPWPSMFAGALRTAMLDARGVSPADLARGAVRDPDLARVVGTSPEKLGSFALGRVRLARENDAGAVVDSFVPLPADLAVAEDPIHGPSALARVPVPESGWRRLGCATNHALPDLAVIRTHSVQKPAEGWWLNGEGQRAHLEARPIGPGSLVRASELWLVDPRIGIALDGGRRSAEKGLIYSTEAVVLAPGVGFLVEVHGAQGLLPDAAVVRIGGDGRGAALRRLAETPGPRRPTTSEGLRWIMASPGVFPDGWRPPGLNDAGVLELRSRHSLPAVSLKLTAAAVPRWNVVSGWDLSRGLPKPAQRAVPPGSVYFFRVERGDPAPWAQILDDEGLWPLLARELEGQQGSRWRARQAEGFNRVYVGAWPAAASD